jgi:hypothetical protein
MKVRAIDSLLESLTPIGSHEQICLINYCSAFSMFLLDIMENESDMKVILPVL